MCFLPVKLLFRIKRCISCLKAYSICLHRSIEATYIVSVLRLMGSLDRYQRRTQTPPPTRDVWFMRVASCVIFVCERPVNSADCVKLSAAKPSSRQLCTYVELSIHIVVATHMLDAVHTSNEAWSKGPHAWGVIRFRYPSIRRSCSIPSI